MIDVVFADDHPIARAGIRAVLSSAEDIRIIGEAASGTEVLRLMEKLRPHILLLDLKMPGPPPFEIERWVREHAPNTATLVLTSHDRDAYLTSMIDAGASGLLDKNASTDRLLGAIRRASQGEILFDRNQMNRARRWREEAGSKWSKLSSQERQIVKLLVQGRDRADISAEIGFVPKTFDYHLTRILEKLEVISQKDLIRWVYKYLSDDLELIPVKD